MAYTTIILQSLQNQSPLPSKNPYNASTPTGLENLSDASDTPIEYSTVEELNPNDLSS